MKPSKKESNFSINLFLGVLFRIFWIILGLPYYFDRGLSPDLRDNLGYSIMVLFICSEQLLIQYKQNLIIERLNEWDATSNADDIKQTNS